MPLIVEPADLFPTRIWQANLAELSPYFPGWVATANALRKASPVAAGRSNRLGWNSSDKAILEQSSFAALRTALRSCCEHAFSCMKLTDPVFSLESWLNIHDRGGFNFQHLHDGVLLSGCFYLRVPSGAGALVFRDPRPGTSMSYLKGGGANAYHDVTLRPYDGLVVLFPNWLEHRVEPNESDISRISISFNAV